MCFTQSNFDVWTFPHVFHQWKPCCNVNYGQLKKLIAACLFRLNFVFLEWDNSFKLSQTLYEGSQGSISRCWRLKEEKSCFCFCKCWDCCVNSPRLSFSFVCSAPFTQVPVGEPFTALFSTEFKLIFSVCFHHWRRLTCGFLGALQLLSNMCVCMCATHIQMMNRSVCERAPLLWTHDTSLLHTFIDNQCRWHHFLHTVPCNQWELCHAF